MHFVRPVSADVAKYRADAPYCSAGDDGGGAYAWREGVFLRAEARGRGRRVAGLPCNWRSAASLRNFALPEIL